MQTQASKFAKQLDTTRTTSDRELWNLRRELNKAQDSHVETIEELRRKQAEEIGITLANERIIWTSAISFQLITEQVKLSMGGTKEAIEQAYQEQLRSIELQQQNQLGKFAF